MNTAIKISKQQIMLTKLQSNIRYCLLVVFSSCNLVILFAFNYESDRNRNKENINICV